MVCSIKSERAQTFSIMKRVKKRAAKFKIGDVPITSPYLRLSKESKAAMHTGSQLAAQITFVQLE